MTTPTRPAQVCILGSAEPGSRAHELGRSYRGWYQSGGPAGPSAGDDWSANV